MPPTTSQAPGPLAFGPLCLEALARLARLLVLGLLVGLACLPLNAVDAWQDQLLQRLPGLGAGAWQGQSLALALAPLVLLPLLLALQRGPLACGGGSGIPQTMATLEHPNLASQVFGVRPTLSRLCLWSGASLALLPLGREGPVVHVGAAVVHLLRRRAPWLLGAAPMEDLLAIGAGAGLAGGFNSPLMGALFVMEELTGRFRAPLMWAALVVCSAAALVSNLTGIPLFPLGSVASRVGELQQLFWALPLGLGGGWLGGLLARWILSCGRWLHPRIHRHPWLWGVVIGMALSGLMLISGGGSAGDGSTLMHQLLLHGSGPDAVGLPDAGQLLSPLPLSWPTLSVSPGTAPDGATAGWTPVQMSIQRAIQWAILLVARLVGPVLALGAGTPGGLIDPALAIGAVFGGGALDLLGGNPQLGIALGMASTLAGATQLPLVTLVFCLRLAGDQQWLFGILLSAVLGACSGRWIQLQPINHALTDALLVSLRARRAGRTE